MEQSSRADLNHLLVFHQVAQTGSYTAAARALGRPKSTISRQVAALETRLGARLLERTTRRLRLTEIGQTLLTHCERVLAEAEEAENAVLAYRAEPAGLLRVGVPVTFARSFLAPLLPAFCQRYPRVQLDLVVGGGRLDPLEHSLDVIIQVGRLADSSYVVRRLGSMPLALHASAEYAGRHGLPKTPAELAEHAIIAGTRRPGGVRWRLRHRGGESEAEVRLEPRLAVADPVVAHVAAAGGIGIAMLPAFLANEDQTLVRVLPEWAPEPIGFWALYAARRLNAPKLRVFLETIEAQLRF